MKSNNAIFTFVALATTFQMYTHEGRPFEQATTKPVISSAERTAAINTHAQEAQHDISQDVLKAASTMPIQDFIAQINTSLGGKLKLQEQASLNNAIANAKSGNAKDLDTLNSLFLQLDKNYPNQNFKTTEFLTGLKISEKGNSISDKISSALNYVKLQFSHVVNLVKPIESSVYIKPVYTPNPKLAEQAKQARTQADAQARSDNQTQNQDGFFSSQPDAQIADQAKVHDKAKAKAKAQEGFFSPQPEAQTTPNPAIAKFLKSYQDFRNPEKSKGTPSFKEIGDTYHSLTKSLTPEEKARFDSNLDPVMLNLLNQHSPALPAPILASNPDPTISNTPQHSTQSARQIITIPAHTSEISSALTSNPSSVSTRPSINTATPSSHTTPSSDPSPRFPLASEEAIAKTTNHAISQPEIIAIEPDIATPKESPIKKADTSPAKPIETTSPINLSKYEYLPTTHLLKDLGINPIADTHTPADLATFTKSFKETFSTLSKAEKVAIAKKLFTPLNAVVETNKILNLPDTPARVSFSEISNLNELLNTMSNPTPFNRWKVTDENYTSIISSVKEILTSIATELNYSVVFKIKPIIEEPRVVSTINYLKSLNFTPIANAHDPADVKKYTETFPTSFKKLNPAQQVEAANKLLSTENITNAQAKLDQILAMPDTYPDIVDRTEPTFIAQKKNIESILNSMSNNSSNSWNIEPRNNFDDSYISTISSLKKIAQYLKFQLDYRNL